MNLAREFSTSGRLGRQGFWLRHLTLVPLALWATIAAGHSPGPPFDLPVAAATTLMLISLWGRRLHDRGRSAWWLLAVAVPVLGALALAAECGLRGPGRLAGRYGATPGLRSDYLAVPGAPAGTPAP